MSNKVHITVNGGISNLEVIKPSNIESTALGAGILAGVKNHFWKNIKEPFKYKKIDNHYTPKMKESERKKMINGWELLVKDINK